MTSFRTGEIQYSIVVPVFNEEAVLPILLKRLDALMDRLDGPCETIFVDDGSTDCSSIVLRARAKDDPRYRYISLARNFGQQAAASAGLEAASGAAVVIMDADLQDPPEIVHDMVARWKEGYDVVYARRLTREGDSAIKRWTARLFYKCLGRLSSIDIPSEVGDFRLLDRKVVDAFCAMPERDRFIRGMFSWLGFRQTAVTFDRPARAAGESKYSFLKLAILAGKGVIGFSDAPLRFAIWLGAAVCGISVFCGFVAISLYLFTRAPELAPSSFTLLIIISTLCGINMLLIGILGLYVGSIHIEVKQRPLYIVERRVGFSRKGIQAESQTVMHRVS